LVDGVLELLRVLDVHSYLLRDFHPRGILILKPVDVEDFIDSDHPLLVITALDMLD
jgi:hypothetical protein